MRTVTVIQAPTSAGGYAPGQEDGPRALLEAGLVERLGVVYVDRHADLNVPDSTVDGALDWMGVAHMLDIDGAVDGLAALVGPRPMLSCGQISYLGLGPHTDFEAAVISDRGLPVVD